MNEFEHDGEAPMGISAILLERSIKMLNEEVDAVEAKTKAFDAFSLTRYAQHVWDTYQTASSINDSGMQPSDPIPDDVKAAILRAKDYLAEKGKDKGFKRYFNQLVKINEEMEKFPEKWVVDHHESQPEPCYAYS